VRSLCSDRQPHFCSWECEHFRSRPARRSIYFVDKLLQFSTSKLQVPSLAPRLPLFLPLVVLLYMLVCSFHLRLCRLKLFSTIFVAGPFQPIRVELAGFLCNTYLRRCDIVGSGNPDCFGIKANSSEIHRCCSNPDQERQPEEGCFAEWPQGAATPATFHVCCTPGIRYGRMLYLFLSPECVP
jgi:hypothetical protein